MYLRFLHNIWRWEALTRPGPINCHWRHKLHARKEVNACAPKHFMTIMTIKTKCIQVSFVKNEGVSLFLIAKCTLDKNITSSVLSISRIDHIFMDNIFWKGYIKCHTLNYCLFVLYIVSISLARFSVVWTVEKSKGSIFLQNYYPLLLFAKNCRDLRLPKSRYTDILIKFLVTQ